MAEEEKETKEKPKEEHEFEDILNMGPEGKPKESKPKAEESPDSPEAKLQKTMLAGMGKKEEEAEEEEEKKKPAEEAKGPAEDEPTIFALRTTANREDQVMDFITGNVAKKKELNVYSVIRPHGMRGYIFVEAETKADAEQAAQGIPYARGILPSQVNYREIEHMLEQVKQEINIKKNDIAEIISGPFKREKCKITRIDKAKEEVVVELLEAAVPIPITVKIDAVKVIRRDSDGSEGKESAE